MFFILSKVLNFLLKPLLWIFVLMLLGLFLKKKKTKQVVLVLATACLFILGNEPIADFFTDRWEYPAVHPASLEHYNYGIVLSGMGAFDESSKSFRFYDESDRIIQAVNLYHLEKLDKIILTGGSGRLIENQHKEAHYLKQYLLDWGIPRNDILVEKDSRNTYENARNTAEKYHDQNGSYLLITSAFHMRRALGCFKKQGINPEVFPTGPNRDNSAKDIVYYILPNVHA
ncbi:MAG: YdcF family protein, partial [Bacteroidota bacterium]